MYYIDPTFTTKKINKALKEKREITFKDGIYKLTECLILHSETKITCESGVAFERHCKGRMLQTFADENTTKYNGVHDVSWYGGSFYADTNEAFANVITLFHAKNITLENVTVSGCRGYHSIEINACKGIMIQSCCIKDQSSKEGENFREAFSNYPKQSTRSQRGKHSVTSLKRVRSAKQGFRFGNTQVARTKKPKKKRAGCF